ncbi:glycosyltransferase involved in cell wall biosynthesis [Luteibacter rhizovicinus]|uniref:Glycosyltransferase involved in cell wall biosynthesis n=1 Tax=Luteibacter rhizovicinus TaxID=242606 RepID=A0A4R3Z1F7_9GAMM|nr:glycosyltransferase family 4 protein [Luteibacter rhizovicinus]TCV97613.1 glycosyltransferase involved in cell wall biosynthesis [Luteibacter rhizovicinus]
MNIVYHHRTRGRHVEGVHIRGIVNALRELGHEVSVVSFPGADPEHEPPPAQATAKRGRLASAVSRLPGVLFEFLELAYNLVTFVRLGLSISRRRPDLIYERYSLFLFATVWLARERNIPLVLEINDSALVQRVRPLKLRKLARRMEAWCLRNATGLVFISTYFRDEAQKAYGDIAPSVISPNAVDLATFDPARFDRKRLRVERGLAYRIVCGHIGVFAHWHGVDGFVEAIAARLAEVPELALVFVGDGVTLPAVRALVAERGLSDRVLLPGRVGHDDIASWIACMDYAVLPNSNHYGSPMKLFEFMGMGVPVVAPDYAPVAEVIDNDRTGWLFPRGEIAACVERVLELALCAEDRRRIGGAAREYIQRERQWSNNAQQLLSLVPVETAS